jgi:ketosteroid isomerase-like protein
MANDADTDERVEIIRRAWEPYTREPVTLERVQAGDFEQAFADYYTEDVVWDMSGVNGWLGPSTYYGYAGVKKYFEDWFGALDQATFEIERMEAIGDAVLTIAHGIAYGRASRTPLEFRYGWINEMVGSKCVRVRVFSDAEEAERAASGT